jgi:hypothetical protein
VRPMGNWQQCVTPTILDIGVGPSTLPFEIGGEQALQRVISWFIPGMRIRHWLRITSEHALRIVHDGFRTMGARVGSRPGWPSSIATPTSTCAYLTCWGASCLEPKPSTSRRRSTTSAEH